MYNKDDIILRSVTDKHGRRFYVSIVDEKREQQTSRVELPIYDLYLDDFGIERKMRHEVERHREHAELSDEETYSRAVNKPKSPEDAIVDKLQEEHFRCAVNQLPEIQRRRFLLHYDYSLTYEQIADVEGCTKMPIKRSIDRAKEKLRKIF